MLYLVDEEGRQRQMDSGKAGRTTLIEYFRLCQETKEISRTGIKPRSLLYTETPKYYAWNKDKKRLEARVNKTPAV